MNKFVKQLGLVLIVALTATNLTGCFDKPTEPIVKTNFTFEVSSSPISAGSAYLQVADLITYTASGAGTVHQMPTNLALPWSASAEVELGSGAGLSVSYTSTMLDPTAATRMANTSYVLIIKKDGNVVKSETVSIEANDPQHSISWTTE